MLTIVSIALFYCNKFYIYCISIVESYFILYFKYIKMNFRYYHLWSVILRNAAEQCCKLVSGCIQTCNTFYSLFDWKTMPSLTIHFLCKLRMLFNAKQQFLLTRIANILFGWNKQSILYFKSSSIYLKQGISRFTQDVILNAKPTQSYSKIRL